MNGAGGFTVVLGQRTLSVFMMTRMIPTQDLEFKLSQSDPEYTYVTLSYEDHQVHAVIWLGLSKHISTCGELGPSAE